MAQSLVGTQLRPVFQEDSGVITLHAASTDPVSTMVLSSMIQNLAVELIVGVRTLDAFLVEAQFHPSGDWFTLTAAVTAVPAGLILAASGTLASLAPGNGWFIMDVRGLYAVRVSASCITDDTGTLRIIASGS